MKKYFLLLVALLFLAGCTNLPDDCIVNLYMDSTSSGGNREYNAELVFENGEIISGEQSYEFFRSVEESAFYRCELDDTLIWVRENNSYCAEIGTYLIDLPLTKEGVEDKIDSGEWKKSVQHGEISYTIE